MKIKYLIKHTKLYLRLLDGNLDWNNLSILSSPVSSYPQEAVGEDGWIFIRHLQIILNLNGVTSWNSKLKTSEGQNALNTPNLPNIMA